jgi:hypothetical protein
MARTLVTPGRSCFHSETSFEVYALETADSAVAEHSRLYEADDVRICV